MKKVLSREEWLSEQAEQEFEKLDENEFVDVDIELENEPGSVEKALDGMGVEKRTTTDFGVIKASIPKRILGSVRGIPGVHKVTPYGYKK